MSFYGFLVQTRIPVKSRIPRICNNNLFSFI
nr:MAG TPA: hypothetical protein [Caudoviricetes sp.]